MSKFLNKKTLEAVPEAQAQVQPKDSLFTLTKVTMFFALLFAAIAIAQNSTTSTSSPAFDISIPTNAPNPGNYNGVWRPQIHFSPPTNFMNDPNGCFRDANGTWHLYYQCISLPLSYSQYIIPLYLANAR